MSVIEQEEVTEQAGASSQAGSPAAPHLAAITHIAILPVPVGFIFAAPNSAAILRAYAAECLVPDAEPQPQMYAAMEAARSLRCFAAYGKLGPLPDSPLDPSLHLLGFCSVMTAIVPHDGHLVATTESLFVDPAYRHTSAFEDLFSAAEAYATAAGCRVLTASARVGSALDRVLSRRAGFSPTHRQHTKWLGEYGPRVVESAQTASEPAPAPAAEEGEL